MVPREEHDGFFTAPAARRRCSSIAAGTDHAAGATVGLPVLPCRRAPQAHKQTDSPTCTMPAPGSPAAPQVFSPSPVSMGGALWHGVFLSPVIPAGTLSDSLIDRGRSINARVPALVGAPALLPPSDIGVPTTISTSVYRRSARIDIALNMRSCIHGVWAAPAMRRQAILHPPARHSTELSVAAEKVSDDTSTPDTPYGEAISPQARELLRHLHPLVLPPMTTRHAPHQS